MCFRQLRFGPDRQASHKEEAGCQLVLWIARFWEMHLLLTRIACTRTGWHYYCRVSIREHCGMHSIRICRSHIPETKPSESQSCQL